MNRRWLLPAALALGTGVLIAVLIPKAKDEGPSVPVRISAPADQATPSMQWRPGVAQQYRVLTESSMQMQGMASEAASMRVHLHGLLDTLTLEADADQALVGMRLSSVQLRINGVMDAETNRALGVPFRMRIAANGMPLAFEFPAAADQLSRSTLENLVRTFQVILDRGDDWVTQECNGSGTYEAVYRRSGPDRFEKSKRRFSSATAGMVRWSEINSTETFRVDTGRDWLAAMEVTEDMSTAGQDGPAMKVSNRATLELQADARVALTATLWDFVAADAGVGTRGTIKDAAPDLTAEQARSQIEATLPVLDAAEQGRLAHIHRLRDLLRVDASLPAILLDALQTQDLSDRTRADLYLALELAGTDSAQAALSEVINNSSVWSLQDGMRAIVAMGGITQPTPESLSTLWNAARNYAGGERERMASSAAFALGTIGSHLREAEDPGYATLRSDLLASALGSDNAATRSVYITALGNTQDPTLAGKVVDMMSDAAPAVRRAAALSLGSLGVDPVAGRLVSRFREEGDVYVRGAIAESLQAWTEPTESAMALFRQAVRTEADESARYNIALLLGDNLAKFPANGPVLREIMRTEPSKRIRQKVAEALTANR